MTLKLPRNGEWRVNRRSRSVVVGGRRSASVVVGRRRSASVIALLPCPMWRRRLGLAESAVSHGVLTVVAC